MGCDGGTIPKRHELVKVAKKKEKKDSDAVVASRTFYCQLSHTLLQAPIVADQIGRLYNKDIMLTKLLEKDPSESNGVYSMKQLTTLNPTQNPDFIQNESDNHAPPDSSALQSEMLTHTFIPQFICPITRKEFNGKNSFCFLASCGCVLSEQALKEIKSQECLVCTRKFTLDDVVQINPNREQLARLQERQKKLNEVIDKEIAEKRSKKRKKDSDKAALKAKRSKHTDSVDGTVTTMDKPKAAPTIKPSSVNAAVLNKLEVERKKSSAIDSLYTKKGQEKQTNWLSKGTFTRYSSYQ